VNLSHLQKIVILSALSFIALILQAHSAYAVAGGGAAPEPGSIALLLIGGGLVGNKIRKNRKARREMKMLDPDSKA
jgi:hypothetical protein